MNNMDGKPARLERDQQPLFSQKRPKLVLKPTQSKEVTTMSFVPDLAQSCRENDELIADHEIIDHCAWMSSQADSRVAYPRRILLFLAN
jgi:hypothetical protein